MSKPADEVDAAAFKSSLQVFKKADKRSLICEFLGTFCFSYFANWAYTVNVLNSQSITSYAISVGLLYAILIYAGQSTSGGIYNISFTVALLLYILPF